MIKGILIKNGRYVYTDRRCFMLEHEPEYCDVIIKRWELATGDIAAPAFQ